MGDRAPQLSRLTIGVRPWKECQRAIASWTEWILLKKLSCQLLPLCPVAVTCIHCHCHRFPFLGGGRRTMIISSPFLGGRRHVLMSKLEASTQSPLVDAFFHMTSRSIRRLDIAWWEGGSSVPGDERWQCREEGAAAIYLFIHPLL